MGKWVSEESADLRKRHCSEKSFDVISWRQSVLDLRGPQAIRQGRREAGEMKRIQISDKQQRHKPMQTCGTWRGKTKKPLKVITACMTLVIHTDDWQTAV